MTEFRLLKAHEPEWDEWLDVVPHDFYHTAAYHRLAETCGEGESHLAIYGSRDRFVAWPYLLRPVNEIEGLERFPFCDVASVYGYPGPLVWNCEVDSTFLTEAWRALVVNWREQMGITVFTRFHPLLGNHDWLQTQSSPMPEPCAGAHVPALGAVSMGQTVSIDLTRSDQATVHEYQKVLRQEIAAGRRAGLVTSADTEWRHTAEFVNLYHQTMIRNQAASQYFFSHDYIERLIEALEPHVHLFASRLQDRIAAAGIFVEYRGIVQAHLAGSSDELRALSPLKVLLDDVRRWAQSRGNRILHLGGGRAGRDDSLLAFKGRFSKRRHQFHVGRWVLEPAAYSLMCHHAGVHGSKRAEGMDDEEFFPPYRAPRRCPSRLYASPSATSNQ